MDDIHDELDQNFFDGIDPRPNKIKFVRDHFYDGMRDAIPHPEDYLSLYLTGSLTTYQYSDNSDCDISVFPDYDKLPEVMGLPDANAVRKALVGIVIKKLDGIIVPGTSHPVQHFVVLVDNKPQDLYKPGMRSAWSFQTESWFVPPEKERVHNVQQELPIIYLRAHAIADKMRMALDTDVDAAKRLFHRIHIKRTQDQQAGRGDFSEGNIVYKYLLHEGLFDRLKAIGVYIAKAAADYDVPLQNPVSYDFVPLTESELSAWMNLPLGKRTWWTRKASKLNQYANNRGMVRANELYAVSNRYQGRCAYCGKPGATSWDHVIPLSKGGQNVISNLLPCHTSCNSFLNDWDQKLMPSSNPPTVSPEWLNVPAEAKVAAEAPTQIIYDFVKDRIILGTKAESAQLPNTILIGMYHDGHATMFEAAHQWLNTAYFKKLWLHSFPTWPLKGISIQGPSAGHERVA